MMHAIAPGKVMLAGEYAVLEGGDALVMAVDRFAIARLGEGAPLPRESVATLAAAQREGVLACDHVIHLDTRALEDGDRKLGLGSSAAGCSAALVLAATEEGVAVNARRARLAALARRGHREAQGGGSGVDVLASMHGGVIAVRFPEGTDREPVVESMAWPSSLPWCVLWTGVPVRTAELIRAVKTFAARDAKGMAECMTAIRDAAAQFEAALRAANAADAVRAVRAHATAMDRLGTSSDAHIVTDAMRQLATAVEPLGGAIKPSGAGGGDIVFAVAQDRSALDAVIRAGREKGFVPLDLAIDPKGARTIAGDPA
jgi:phosphomevalonate kinase